MLILVLNGSPLVYGSAITRYYQSIVECRQVENAVIFTSNGDANRPKEKWD